jgi:hypothetical protein
MQFKVIGYYTKATRYEELSWRLLNSCDAFAIPHYIEAIEDLGSWEKNTHHKSQFVKECLEKFPGEDLLYVDVDAVFNSYPVLIPQLPEDVHIAYRTENFPWRKDEPLSGTIFFRNTPKTLQVVEKWQELNQKTPAVRNRPETWEQQNLKRALEACDDVIYYNLPPEYTFITDHTRRLFPGLQAIVEHYQESRNQHKRA